MAKDAFLRSLTPKERSEFGRRAVNVRWARYREKGPPPLTPERSEAMRQLALQRLAKMTPEQQAAHCRMMREAVEPITPERRREMGTNAINKRWAAVRAQQESSMS